MCRSSEISKSQLKDMSNEQETVNFLGSNSKGKFQKSTPARTHGANPKAKKETETIACKYCGGKHKKDKQLCPACGEICTNCQLKNHFHRVCKQRKKSDLERSTNSVNRLDNSSDSDDSLYNVEHFVGAVKPTGKKWLATLDLNIERMPACSVTCQMDCGSTCNILSFIEYCKIAQDGNPDLQKSNAKLQLYDGSTMVPMGTCTLHWIHEGKNYELDFQVVNVDQKPLLSVTTCE